MTSSLPAADAARAFARWAWAVLVVSLLVIVWGAFVRASGSGAGCGAHWPTCNGDIVPHAESIETAIELTHRITSGLALVLVLVSLVWSRRLLPVGHYARRAAGYAMVFMLLEAAVGAALVLLRLTGDDSSIARAVVIGVHLVNTFLLVGALTLTAVWAVPRPPPISVRSGAGSAVLGGAGLLVLVGVAGAITALGDTLFPADSLAAGMAADLSPTAHFLVRLRIVHPALAIAAFVYLAILATLLPALRPAADLRIHGRVLVIALVSQVACGFLDLALLAPTWLQLCHLFIADLVWVALVLFGVRALAAPAEVAASPAAEPAAA